MSHLKSQNKKQFIVPSIHRNEGKLIIDFVFSSGVVSFSKIFDLI